MFAPGRDLPAFPPRPDSAHKGSMGRALLVAGSRGMAGAAILATGGALRAGAGYALVDCPGGIARELTDAYPEGVLHLHGGADRGHLLPADVPTIIESCRHADAIGLGPGLGSSADAQALVEQFLPTFAMDCGQKPLVLDADGLNHVAAARVDLHALGIPALLLTPHPAEAARLLGWDGAAQVQADRPAAAAKLASKTGAVVLLKGAGTLVASPSPARSTTPAAAGRAKPDAAHRCTKSDVTHGRSPWQNSSGNPGMATAGSGDVLTGILTTLLARGLAPEAAAKLAAYLHGLAGDLAVQEVGQESLIASDLIRFLPAAILQHQTAS